MIDLLRLCRLYYVFPMSSILPLTIWYAAGDAISDELGATLCATIALALVIAGGYVLNDVCDRQVDRVNAPRSPIPSGRVHPRTAAVWAGLLLLSGLATASLCRWQFLAALAVVAIILVFYDLTSKHLGVGKQLTVALLMTSYYPLAFAQAGSTASSRVLTLAIFPVWIFLTSFGYETLKDIRDIPGDLAVSVKPTWVQRRPRLALGVARAAVIAGAVVLLGPGFAGCGCVYMSIIPGAILLAIWSTLLPQRQAVMAIYGEFVLVGVAATADIMILGA
jgi:geranylgeranylglycerol-phosphate geranylgeranyltransferase